MSASCFFLSGPTFAATPPQTRFSRLTHLNCLMHFVGPRQRRFFNSLEETLGVEVSYFWDTSPNLGDNAGITETSQ